MEGGFNPSVRRVRPKPLRASAAPTAHCTTGACLPLQRPCMCVYPRSARSLVQQRAALPAVVCASWLGLTTCSVWWSMVGGMRAQLYKDCLRLVFHVASEV
jgi:hypothetical protein